MSNGQKTTVFWGDNPTRIYMQAMFELLLKGKEVGPRGKLTKELRPVVIEYHNPLERVTFLKGRIINPFFQLAESLWILAGRSDVEWLAKFNSGIAQFSDDGKFFNAPYGERLRSWGKNDASGFVFNPIDQLHDCYLKLKQDPDTRQAVAFIGDPRFDNSAYTLAGGKDIACNINIKFKIREGKLDITVDNRSNDLHWGTFGANLAQFSTIQEVMASWLGIPVGTYVQETDSLHIYLDEYGAKETEKVLKAYGYETDEDIYGSGVVPTTHTFSFDTEPRFSSDYDGFTDLVTYYFDVIDPMVTSEELYSDKTMWLPLLDEISTCPDRYLRMTFQSMFVKHAHNHKKFIPAIAGLKAMEDSSWKVSCLRFLSKTYASQDPNGYSLYPEFKSVYSHLHDDIKDYIERKEG